MFPLKLIVNIHSHDDRMVGVITLVIRVAAGMTPMIRRTVVKTTRMAGRMPGTLIVKVMGKEVSVSATQVCVMRRGRRTPHHGVCRTRLDRRGKLASNVLASLSDPVTTTGSRVVALDSSGAAGALVETTVHQGTPLRGPEVAYSVGALR